MNKDSPKPELDKQLDDALMATFPCSDPFSFQTSGTDAGGENAETDGATDKSHPPHPGKTRAETGGR